MATRKATTKARAMPHDAIQMRVSAGEQIPEPGGIVQARSPMTGYLYAIRVHSIARVAWATEGDDIIGIDVWLCGEKQVVGDSVPDESRE